MLDTTSRSIVAHRIMDERQAEARRAHLISEARRERPDYEAHGPTVASPSALGRLAAAVRDLGRVRVHVGGSRAHPAALR